VPKVVLKSNAKWNWTCNGSDGGKPQACWAAKVATAEITTDGQVVESFDDVSSIYDKGETNFKSTYPNSCANLVKKYYKTKLNVNISSLTPCSTPTVTNAKGKTFVETISPSVGDIACWSTPGNVVGLNHWAIVKTVSPVSYFEQNFKYSVKDQKTGITKYYAVLDRPSKYTLSSGTTLPEPKYFKLK
jgi:hypothetical protein